MRDIPSCKWLDQWTELAQKYDLLVFYCFSFSCIDFQCGTGVYLSLDSRFAFQYNPSLQPRALVVFGCISKRVSHGQIKQIIRILSKASPLLSIDRVRALSHLPCSLIREQNVCFSPLRVYIDVFRVKLLHIHLWILLHCLFDFFIPCIVYGVNGNI